ncbi:ATP-binding protein [Desulfovermiculus halophilus]|jgi:serine/threonine-protein kinase RsbW|uniref:ATP-binding protein n=1 Tax=Desulfovermiculus halophilus TaxID=339722 RepID=UPI00068559E5|nr:ATP-binding protein [Desulfovermiculus halophilus]
MAHKIYQSLAAPEQINALTKSVADFLQHWIHDQELIYDLRLVLHEACTNVLLHSYGRDAGGELEVHIHIDPRKRIRLEVRDNGPPFQGPEQSIRSSAPQDESGRGLFIISRLVDSFAYQYAQGQNTLSMERVIEERAWKG